MEAHSSLASPRPVSPSSTSGPGLSFSAECSPVSGLQLHPVTSPLLQVSSQHTAVLQVRSQYTAVLPTRARVL